MTMESVITPAHQEPVSQLFVYLCVSSCVFVSQEPDGGNIAFIYASIKSAESHGSRFGDRLSQCPQFNFYLSGHVS